MLKLKSEYFEEWRNKNPNKWHLIQLKHYHKNKHRIKLGFQKPKGMTNDEYDIYQQRFDKHEPVKAD